MVKSVEPEGRREMHDLSRMARLKREPPFPARPKRLISRIFRR